MFKTAGIVLASALVIALAGCATTDKSNCGMSGDKDANCGMEKSGHMMKHAYDPKTKTLMGYSGTVHDAACNKDCPAGSYCEKCNRFMIPGTVHCKKCDKDFPAGSYCPNCKKYMGVHGVGYCEHCKAPHDTSAGCAACKGMK
jgi:hypothetical protein